MCMRRELTNKVLKRLQTKLQANTSSIKIDLGEGKHSYLALVLTNTEYSSVLNT